MLNTKNVLNEKETNNVSKVLLPGNCKFVIHSVELGTVPYDSSAYTFSLNVESEKIEGLEGFYIDKNDPSKGRFEGQVGKIKLNKYAYKSTTTKTGIEINRDLEILRAIRNICKETDCINWFEAQDNQHDTIESFVEQFNNDKPFANKWLIGCVAGREYLNAKKYKNYDLYFPKVDKGFVAFQNADSEDLRVATFNSSEHIERLTETSTKPANKVESFGSTVGAGDDLPF